LKQLTAIISSWQQVSAGSSSWKQLVTVGAVNINYQQQQVV